MFRMKLPIMDQLRTLTSRSNERVDSTLSRVSFVFAHEDFVLAHEGFVLVYVSFVFAHERNVLAHDMIIDLMVFMVVRKECLQPSNLQFSSSIGMLSAGIHWASAAAVCT
jgi:hypothetical protein